MTTKEIIEMLRVCADDDIICPACPRYEQYEYGGTAECYEKLMLEAADALEAALREQEDRRWIPVTERLPERDGQYLCNYHFGKHRDMTFTRVLDYYVTDSVPHFQHTLGDTTMKVTHWMPMPEPPKEDT